MTRALALSQREAQKLLRAAAAERGIVEVKIGDRVFRLIPECYAQKDQPIDAGNDEGDLDAELTAFEAKHGDD
jgi:DNA-binding transcriptional regulator LsrR (DeoR family)